MAIKTLRETIDYGRPAGDVEFEFLEAGKYNSSFWANGYMYRIRKDFYDNKWYCYYTFAKWPYDREKGRDGAYCWRRFGSSYGCETLKEAKVVCINHNLNPRKKWKLIKKITDTNSKNYGKLMYQVFSNGKLQSFSSYLVEPMFKVIEESCTDGE